MCAGCADAVLNRGDHSQSCRCELALGQRLVLSGVVALPFHVCVFVFVFFCLQMVLLQFANVEVVWTS